MGFTPYLALLRQPTPDSLQFTKHFQHHQQTVIEFEVGHADPEELPETLKNREVRIA